jgi:hypothetical protein
MANNPLPPQPSATSTDYFAVIMKLGIAAFPDWGGSAAELFGMVTAPLLGKRRDAWFEDLRLRFNDLIGEVEGLSPEALATNETFISALL